MTEPSSPALVAIWRAGACSALRTISTPVFWSSFAVRTFLSASVARSSATPPPGSTPSSTAARVACIASSTRSLRSFTSTSVAPPTRITATPPASLASRSCSFSRSESEVVSSICALICVMRSSMSFFLPPPLTIVVFSLSIITFLALPSIASVTFSSLMPRSSLIAWPPVRTAMSCSMALRRSPQPGAFTAATLEAPRQFVDPQRRQRLALDVFGDDEERLAGLHDGFQERKQFIERRQLLLVDEDVGVLHLDAHLVGVGGEVRRG